MFCILFLAFIFAALSTLCLLIVVVMLYGFNEWLLHVWLFAIEAVILLFVLFILILTPLIGV